MNGGAQLRRPGDYAVTYQQRLGPAIFVGPDPSQVDTAVEASVTVAGLGREPAEEFTGTLATVRVDLLPTGQSPRTPTGVLLAQKNGDKCALHLERLALVAKKGLRVIL